MVWVLVGKCTNHFTQMKPVVTPITSNEAIRTIFVEEIHLRGSQCFGQKCSVAWNEGQIAGSLRVVIIWLLRDSCYQSALAASPRVSSRFWWWVLHGIRSRTGKLEKPPFLFCLRLSLYTSHSHILENCSCIHHSFIDIPTPCKIRSRVLNFKLIRILNFRLVGKD